MVPKLQEQIGDNSLLNYGTWAYLADKSGKNASERYLFWTSVDTNAIGAGKKIPVIQKVTLLPFLPSFSYTYKF